MQTPAKYFTGSSILPKAIGLLICIGFLLTLFSLAEVCTSSCKHTHAYRILGLHFEFFGLLFFAALTVLFFSIHKGRALLLLPAAAMSGVGAELWFAWLQYVEGKVCPVCALIGAVVLALAVLISLYVHHKGLNMSKKVQIPFYVMALFAGLLFSLFAVTKISAEEQRASVITKSLPFGEVDHPVKIYIFTDWFCPSCARIEPVFEQVTKKLSNKAAIFFMDLPIHPESTNFTPYNIAFLVHNKDSYFSLRHALHNLAMSSKYPNDEDVEKAIASTGVQLNEMSYTDIASTIRLFRETANQFHVSSTPSLVVYNSRSEEAKVLIGSVEITLENVEKAYHNITQKQ